MKDKLYSRRDFTKILPLVTLGTMPLISNASSLLKPAILPHKKLKILVFSKHLQFLNYKDMAEAAKEIGFDGVDLTVRSKGHVLPKNVLEDLPKATEAIKSVGFNTDMITTKIKDINDPFSLDILKTAENLGYEFCRMGWLKYDKNLEVLDNFEGFKKKMKGISLATKELGIKGTYQNHAGKYMGSAIWDLDQVLEGIDLNHLGCQYDITHATAEGGKNWEIGFKLIKDHINSLVIKDFKWKKTGGKWKTAYMPLGEGMVDFDRYLMLIKKYDLNLPISLHYEYDLGGAEHGDKKITIDKKEVFARMKKDVQFLRNKWATIE